MTISPSDVTLIKMKFAELESALLQKLPSMPNILRDIHTQMKSTPECVTILAEEDIGLLIKGLGIYAQQDLATEVIKGSKTAKTKNAIKSITADDL